MWLARRPLQPSPGDIERRCDSRGRIMAVTRAAVVAAPGGYRAPLMAAAMPARKVL